MDVRRGALPIITTALLVMSASAAITPAAAGPPESARHPSGLTLVGPAVEVEQIPEALSESLGEAERLAEENPKDFGYAWVDREKGSVVLDAVSPRGRALAAEMQTRRGQGRGRPEVRAVRKDQATLEDLKHEVIDLGGPLREDGAWRSEVDPENGRVVLTVTGLSDASAAELVRRYGTEQVAVRVDPDRPEVDVQSRTNDTSPFYGGARINTPVGGCSNAFSWYSGTTSYMLTAGHCASSGGSISTPAMAMGLVTATSRENWHSTAGTQYLTGQSVYRGDIALIHVPSPRSTTARMFRGDINSSSSALVGEMWSRRPQSGDQYCTGGTRSGEVCGWTVDAARVDIRYSSGAVVRNAVSSRSKQGWCTRPGDSGGPVYTVRPDGKVAAKGIISGGGGGGSDYYGGLFDQCTQIFTDIYEAYYGFPGYLRVG